MSATNDEYNCLHVHNNSLKTITVFIYEGVSPVCIFSSFSKTLEPEQNFSHYNKKPFKFEIFEIENSKNKKEERKFLGPKQCFGIRKMTISDENNLLKCQQNILSENDEKRIVRRMKRENDLPSEDLYEQLGLDMREVRKMNEDQRKKAIQKGFLKMILIWHPDKPNGDKEIADQLVQARNILLNDENRAQYHNQIDIQQGWFSLRRWKAIFAPEMVTAEQYRAFFKRLAFFGLSSLLAAGGVATSVCTAGLAAPGFVILGAIAGGALTFAGLQSLGETVSKESVVHGMDVEKWAKKALIGGVAGALAGGLSGGITAAIVGIGSAALPSAAISIGQYVSMGAVNGAFGGSMFSLSSVLAKKIVDEKDISNRQILLHTLCGALIGATAGISGGAVTEPLVNSGTEAARPTPEGDASEQFSMQASRKNIHDVGCGVAKKAAEEGTKSTANVPFKFADERLDSSVENRRLTTHMKEGAQTIVLRTSGMSIIQAFGETQGYSLLNEMKEIINPVDENLGDMLQSLINDNLGNISNGIDVYPDFGQESVDCPDGPYGNEDRYNDNENVRSRENAPEPIQSQLESYIPEYRTMVCEQTYYAPQETANTFVTNEVGFNKNCSTYRESLKNNSEAENYLAQFAGDCLFQNIDIQLIEKCPSLKEVLTKTIKYKSNGAWISKMIVSYFLNEERETNEVSGDRKRVEISANATDIEVKFQVSRPLWGDVMKYNRFRKTWKKPKKPHIFRYKKAVDRTFTLSGNLWREAVMAVEDEYHEETKEL